MDYKYVKPKRLRLKNHPQFNEKWVQSHIAADPSILDLGDLVLKDEERSQPRAGRLDILLQDRDTQRRYEVELQLGATDEAHIIRTIEYWDIDRKRYPQYEHCAVLVAEDITSRFLNVISLFNGTIPLIAIQMQALQVEENLTLVFTKILDELSRGLVDDDEAPEPTDRTYWERNATKSTVNLADQILGILREIDPTLNLKYNKFYIGLEKDGQPYNFVRFRPKKRFIYFDLKLPHSADVDAMIDDAGLDSMEYSNRSGRYRIRLTENDIKAKSEVLSALSNDAHDLKAGV